MNKHILIILALVCSYVANANATTDTITFNHEDVISIKNDTILYHNPDQFDYDNLAYLAGLDDWYGRYIKVIGREYDPNKEYCIITKNYYNFYLKEL